MTNDTPQILKLPKLDPKPKVALCIYDHVQGLYSKPGPHRRRWHKTPKVWSNWGHIRNHFHLFVYSTYRYRKDSNIAEYLVVINNPYKNANVYDMVTGEIAIDPKTNNQFNITEYLRELALKEQKRLHDSPYKNNHYEIFGVELGPDDY